MEIKKIIALGGALVATHLILREIRKGEPDIHYVDNVPGNFNGLCLPPVGIFINSSQQSNPELLKHELVHWRQYQRMGLGPYYFNYVKDYLKFGYDQHPMEKEARQNEGEYCQNNYTECVRNGTALTAHNPNFRS